MAQVTYKPSSEDSSTCEWHGIIFEANKSVEVKNGDVLRKMRSNPFFEVEEVEEAEVISEENDSAFDRGAKAARDGKPRNAPSRWASNKKGEDWLAGYDSVKEEIV